MQNKIPTVYLGVQQFETLYVERTMMEKPLLLEVNVNLDRNFVGNLRKVIIS